MTINNYSAGETHSELYFHDLVRFEVFCRVRSLLALTATASVYLRTEVSRILGMRNEVQYHLAKLIYVIPWSLLSP